MPALAPSSPSAASKSDSGEEEEKRDAVRERTVGMGDA